MMLCSLVAADACVFCQLKIKERQSRLLWLCFCTLYLIFQLTCPFNLVFDGPWIRYVWRFPWLHTNQHTIPSSIYPPRSDNKYYTCFYLHSSKPTKLSLTQTLAGSGGPNRADIPLWFFFFFPRDACMDLTLQSQSWAASRRVVWDKAAFCVS